MHYFQTIAITDFETDYKVLFYKAFFPTRLGDSSSRHQAKNIVSTDIAVFYFSNFGLNIFSNFVCQIIYKTKKTARRLTLAVLSITSCL